jgi:uncharacterized protein (TIGR02646 family)
VARLGRYCSYCERQIETHLAVEHVQPKSDPAAAALALVWSNFLLACVNCNSSKGSAPITLTNYYWPDVDNTLLAFQYSPGGLIDPNAALTAAQRGIAQASIALVGLDRYPGSASGEPTTSDWRWLRRQETWALAHECLVRLATNNTPEVRELIVEVAVARGMFSIWWTVFAGDADMRGRLRQAFTGTCANSFDAAGNLQARPGGQL